MKNDAVSKLILAIADAAQAINGDRGLWIFVGSGPDDLTWALPNAGGQRISLKWAPHLTIKFRPRGASHALSSQFAYKFTRYGRNKGDVMTGLYPGQLHLTGNVEEDLVTFLEAVEGLLPVFESPGGDDTEGVKDINFGGSSEFDFGPEDFGPDMPTSAAAEKTHASKKALGKEPASGPAAKTWRDYDTEQDIIRAFPFRPKYDDVIDLYQKANAMRSNKLMNLARSRSVNAESLASRLIDQLLHEAPISAKFDRERSACVDAALPGASQFYTAFYELDGDVEEIDVIGTDKAHAKQVAAAAIALDYMKGGKIVRLVWHCPGEIFL
jgi:hypothetical protein